MPCVIINDENDEKQSRANKINYDKFAFGKYSSNVCDLAFRYGTIEQKRKLIEHLTYSPRPCRTPNGKYLPLNAPLFRLVNHEYGNFVAKNIIFHLLKASDVSLNGVNGMNGNNNNNNNNHSNNNGLHLNNRNQYEYKTMNQIIFNYLQQVYPILKNTGKKHLFSYAKNIVCIYEKYC